MDIRMHILNERRNLYIFPNLGLLVKWPQCIYTSEVKNRKTHTELVT